MFVKATTIVSLFALAAQQVAADASAKDINVVKAHFEQSGLVPDLLSTFDPEGVLEVSFGDQKLAIGSAKPQSEVSSAPTVKLDEMEGLDIPDNQRFTAMMVDADVVGTDQQQNPQTFHWLANNVEVKDDQLNFDNAVAIINYAGPGPAEGSGPHRYVIITVPQYENFTAPEGLNTAGTDLGKHSTSEYLSTTGLGKVLAATYFTVENGQATASIPATSSVDESTVASTGAGAVVATTSAGETTAVVTTTSAGQTTGAASTRPSGSASGSAAGSEPSEPGAGMVAAMPFGTGSMMATGMTIVGALIGSLMI